MPSLKILILLIFIFLPGLGVAGQVEPQQTISKRDLAGIKIVSTRYDRISLFLKNNLNKTYRISNLSEKQANVILTRLGDDQVIQIQSIPVEGKDYLDVTGWQ